MEMSLPALLLSLKNWRLVSLLNTDYKIFAKVLASRLASVLVQMIHPDQSYMVPGRRIHDNVHLVWDLIHFCQQTGLPIAFLSLDQEKAFDRFNHEYLFCTLWAFVFRTQFVVQIRLLYSAAECLLKVNGSLTVPIRFGRGVHQSCLLFGRLHFLCMEPFLCLLWRRLSGLVLRGLGMGVVLSAHADNVLLTFTDPADLGRMRKCQAVYSVVSSTRINWAKCSILLVCPCCCLGHPPLLLPLRLLGLSASVAAATAATITWAVCFCCCCRRHLGLPPLLLLPPLSETSTSAAAAWALPQAPRNEWVQAYPHPNITFEACSKAMASMVGPLAIVAAAKMYGKVIFFLKTEQVVHLAMEKGHTVGHVCKNCPTLNTAQPAPAAQVGPKLEVTVNAASGEGGLGILPEGTQGKSKQLEPTLIYLPVFHTPPDLGCPKPLWSRNHDRPSPVWKGPCGHANIVPTSGAPGPTLTYWPSGILCLKPLLALLDLCPNPPNLESFDIGLDPVEAAAKYSGPEAGPLPCLLPQGTRVGQEMTQMALHLALHPHHAHCLLSPATSALGKAGVRAFRSRDHGGRRTVLPGALALGEDFVPKGMGVPVSGEEQGPKPLLPDDPDLVQCWMNDLASNPGGGVAEGLGAAGGGGPPHSRYRGGGSSRGGLPEEGTNSVVGVGEHVESISSESSDSLIPLTEQPLIPIEELQDFVKDTSSFRDRLQLALNRWQIFEQVFCSSGSRESEDQGAAGK
eukprot:g44608.t1